MSGPGVQGAVDIIVTRGDQNSSDVCTGGVYDFPGTVCNEVSQ